VSLLFLFSFFSLYAAPRDLHSFPTRRSSDLVDAVDRLGHERRMKPVSDRHVLDDEAEGRDVVGGREHVVVPEVDLVLAGGDFVRSEEHTSELQSPDHLVCRLLLEKKKK